ncbi:ADAMTS-like protein 5 isoform X1 [Lathamus discolor]|uniref:ADAMTS-like protein 5 isoform X1 n=1 Tax=Lathamus discolor TaxID=678569 RepID=UPI0032B855A2
MLVAAAAPGLAQRRRHRAEPSPGDAGAGPRAPSPCLVPLAAERRCLGALGTLELLLQLLRGRRRPPHSEVPAVSGGRGSRVPPAHPEQQPNPARRPNPAGWLRTRPCRAPAPRCTPAKSEPDLGGGGRSQTPVPPSWSTEEEPCTGEPRQYRLCQLQGCPSGSVPFRAMQCSVYDNKPVLGTSARYQWVPFHGAPNVCDLNCLAVGHNFYYTFGRVLDGTRCGPGSPDLCVSGRCLSVGCDGILGSGVRPDTCGPCSGGHDACLFVHRLFQGEDASSGYFGYVNVTRIPAGASHIKVTDKSRNYLALMTSDGRYVLNGDWSIAWPGQYEAAGTRLRYTRTPDGTESLEAPGPTDEDLQVMVLLQEPNPGIEYEFWLPRGHPQPGHGNSSPLRQPQPRGAGTPPPQEPPGAPALPPQPRSSATEPPPRSPPGRAEVPAGACSPRCPGALCCAEHPGEPRG